MPYELESYSDSLGSEGSLYSEEDVDQGWSATDSLSTSISHSVTSSSIYSAAQASTYSQHAPQGYMGGKVRLDVV